MKRLFTLLIFIFFSSIFVFGQTPGPFYRQFFFNPYLFNPAYVGINNSFEANLSYRQQWTSFEDAPVTAGINLQMPTSERVAIGVNIFSDKQVLLNNTNFIATFGYVVPIASNQSLRFGISAGVGINKLDLTAEELNTNDPAIINAASNNFYVDGNFGVVYTNSGLRLGFALTDLFTSNSFNAESFNEFKISNLRNRLFSVSYRFNIGVMENFSLEPYLLYRQTEDGLQDAWEAASVLYFRDKLWTGASYHQNNGIALFLGFNAKEKFRFSYNYEFPPFHSGFTATSSHEIHLGIRLGSKRSKPMVTSSSSAGHELANIAVTDIPSTGDGKSLHDPNHPGGNKNPARFVEGFDEQTKDMETPINIEEENRVKENVTIVSKDEGLEKIPAPVVVTGESQKIKTEAERKQPTPSELPEAKKEEHKKALLNASEEPTRESFTMARGHHYVVVGVFSVMSHSMKFTKEMLSKGYPINVVLNPKNNLYYVYIYSSLDIEEAKKVRNEYRWKNLFKEAWIFNME